MPRFVKSLIKVITVTTLGLCCSSTCSAVSLNFLLDNDFFTRDPLTGYRWLDVTTSTNMSYNQVSGSMGPGGMFHGWRHATSDEVHDMLGHGGVFNFPFFHAAVSQQTFDAINEVLDLVGVTAVNNQGIFYSEATTGLTSDFDTTLQGRDAISIGATDWVSDDVDDTAIYSSTVIRDNQSSGGYGHWLVSTGQPEEGESEQTPFMPTSSGSGGEKIFNGVAGGGYWYDPPANDMTIATDGNSLFTVIGMPLNYPDSDGQYTVTDSENGSTTLLAGEFYTLPTPVSEFVVSDIEFNLDESPLEGDPVFAAFLQFDQDNVSFSITPVPEPGCWAIGLLLLAACRRSTCHCGK